MSQTVPPARASLGPSSGDCGDVSGVSGVPRAVVRTASSGGRVPLCVINARARMRPCAHGGTGARPMARHEPFANNNGPMTSC